jgi:hypothetical protein
MMKWDEWSFGRRQMARATNTVTRLAVVIVPPWSSPPLFAPTMHTVLVLEVFWIGFASSLRRKATARSFNLCPYTPSSDEIEAESENN